MAHTIEPQTLTLALSRFAVAGTLAERHLDRVPSPAKRERARVRARDSMPMRHKNKRGVERSNNLAR
jgi:hypothetical protein